MTGMDGVTNTPRFSRPISDMSPTMQQALWALPYTLELLQCSLQQSRISRKNGASGQHSKTAPCESSSSTPSPVL